MTPPSVTRDEAIRRLLDAEPEIRSLGVHRARGWDVVQNRVPELRRQLAGILGS